MTPGVAVAERDAPNASVAANAPIAFAPTADRHTPAGAVDFDVHGLLGVRLLDPAPADQQAVERHLRGFRAPLARTPDLTVRFVERLDTRALRCVDVERSGYDARGFFVRGGSARTGWAQLPFAQLGEPCEVVAERGLGQLPYFKPMLRLIALARGLVPLHASAFATDAGGALVTGWTHGGKTSALLAFAEHGARFVGDDLVLLTPDGAAMYGLATPLNVSAAQLRQLPRLRDGVGRGRMLALDAFRRLDAAAARQQEDPAGGGASLALLRKATRPLRRRVALHLPPERAFWNGVQATAQPRTLFLMLSHRRPELVVEPVDPLEVAERMIHSLRFEDLALFGEYLSFRFAFPEPAHANALLEDAHAIARARLRRAFAGIRAFEVRHPYPPPLEALHHAMRPCCTVDAPPSDPP